MVLLDFFAINKHQNFSSNCAKGRLWETSAMFFSNRYSRFFFFEKFAFYSTCIDRYIKFAQKCEEDPVTFWLKFSRRMKQLILTHGGIISTARVFPSGQLQVFRNATTWTQADPPPPPTNISGVRWHEIASQRYCFHRWNSTVTSYEFCSSQSERFFPFHVHQCKDVFVLKLFSCKSHTFHNTKHS